MSNGERCGNYQQKKAHDRPQWSIEGRFYRSILVGARGFEPPTPRSRTECSTRLSHAPTEANVYLTALPTVNATVPFAVARVSRSRTDTSSSYCPGGNDCSGTLCVANACVSHVPGGGRSASEKNCGFVWLNSRRAPSTR